MILSKELADRIREVLYVEPGCVHVDNKIPAIRMVRESTGWGLKDSKDAVDAIAEDVLRSIKQGSDTAVLDRIAKVAERYLDSDSAGCNEYMLDIVALLRQAGYKDKRVFTR